MFYRMFDYLRIELDFVDILLSLQASTSKIIVSVQIHTITVSYLSIILVESDVSNWCLTIATQGIAD